MIIEIIKKNELDSVKEHEVVKETELPAQEPQETDDSLPKLVKVSRKVHHDPYELVLIDYELRDGRMVKMTHDEVADILEKEEKYSYRVGSTFVRTQYLALYWIKCKRRKDKEHMDIVFTNSRVGYSRSGVGQGRVHNEKVKNDDRKKKLYDQYMWTITKGRQEGEITDLLIHPKTKPVAVTMFINYDIRNFEYHKEFKFDDFDPREWDQMGLILRTKHNAMVFDKLNSLSKKYIRLQEIAKSLNIDDSIPLPLQDHSLPKPIQEKRKAMELEPEMMAYSDKSTANQKFVKLMDEMIAARPEKNNLLSKKAKWELMRFKEY
ncbi:hypothetical protein Tco_1013803 [Tanacetum coccineum]